MGEREGAREAGQEVCRQKMSKSEREFGGGEGRGVREGGIQSATKQASEVQNAFIGCWLERPE